MHGAEGNNENSIGGRLNELLSPPFRWEGNYPQVEIHPAEGTGNKQDVLWLEPRFAFVKGDPQSVLERMRAENKARFGEDDDEGKSLRQLNLSRLSDSKDERRAMFNEIWGKDAKRKENHVTPEERLILAAGFINQLEEKHKDEKRSATTKIAALKRGGAKDKDSAIAELKHTRANAELRLKWLPVLRKAIKSGNIAFEINDSVGAWGVRPAKGN